MADSSDTNSVNGQSAPSQNGDASYAEKHNIADHFIGGNKLANAPSSKVKDFVAQHDGHTVITNVSCERIDAMRLRGGVSSSACLPQETGILQFSRRND